MGMEVIKYKHYFWNQPLWEGHIKKFQLKIEEMIFSLSLRGFLRTGIVRSCPSVYMLANAILKCIINYLLLGSYMWYYMVIIAIECDNWNVDSFISRI